MHSPDQFYLLHVTNNADGSITVKIDPSRVAVKGEVYNVGGKQVLLTQDSPAGANTITGRLL